MKTWTQLSPDEARNFYYIPAEIVNNDDNVFFGMEHHPRDLDGPWPLLVFLRDTTHSHCVRFHIFSVLPEAQEFQGFNPLLETGGHLVLDSQSLTDLVDLLREYSRQLPSPPRNNQKMFERIEDSRLRDFHLHPEWFPNSEQSYYRQIYDPLFESEKNSITILLLSRSSIQPSNARLFFQIASFPAQNLQKQSFDPLENAVAGINLDQNSIKELASLLQEFC